MMTAVLAPPVPGIVTQADPFGVSVYRAAELLNVSVNTVRRRVKDKTLASYRLGGRVLVKVDSIKDLVK